MFLCVFFIAALEGSATWHITDTDIYQPLSRASVVLGHDGRIYMLDAKEKRIHIYSAEGKRLKSFGKNGKGPGEMTYPSQLFISKDALFLQDFGNQAVIRFDLDGNFVSQSKTASNSQIIRVANGWVYGNWHYFMGNHDPGVLYWADDDFKEEIELVNMRPEGFKPPNSGNISIDMSKAMPLNPAEDGPHLVVDSRGERVYLMHAGAKFKISVVDVRAKKVVDTIGKDWKRLPFNKEWGERSIAEKNKPKPNQQFPIKFKGIFPDYFPHAKDMVCFGDQLYLQQWTHDPDNKHQVKVLNHKGAEQEDAFPANVFSRIGGVFGDKVLVFTFNEEEDQAGVALCPKSELVSFLKANPLPVFEARGPVMIMR